jgi:signal recognition particle subunit SRP54
MRQQLDNFDESEITRTEAIILSMTKTERRTPKLLNGSRRLRIAKGSGTTVTEVNALVNRFDQAAKMMKTVAKGGMPQMPGMGPVPGAKFGSPKQLPKKKGSKSGNPAKRAAEDAGLALPVAPTVAAGAGFGLGSAAKDSGPSGPTEAELASLQKFLGR